MIHDVLDKSADSPSGGMPASEVALLKAEWQAVLFSPRPFRSRLLTLRPSWTCTAIRVRVHRNHAFEHTASVMQPFLAYAGWHGDFQYSDYDDSLSFAGLQDGASDIEIVWLDFERYAGRSQPAGLASWLVGRLRDLRSRSAAPILVVGWAGRDDWVPAFHTALVEALAKIPGARFCDPSSIGHELDRRLFDERAAALSGTRLSDPAGILLARELACRWIPAALRPRIKAVALDLDNTLYRGVLGEDGPEGVELTSGHAELHRRLLKLRSEGVFLALVSRNETADVERLFAVRDDFPLRWEHFSARAISWAEKSSGLIEVASAMRIGTDAVAFVDDNPGELATVAAKWPQANTVLAVEDATATMRALDWLPGLWAWSAGEAAALRIADLEATAERARTQAEAVDPAEYLRSLRVRIDLAINPRPRLARLVELSQKTNQFNLNLRRLGEVQLTSRLESDSHRVVAIALSDRLADSGLIGLVCGYRDGEALIVDELCVSCRALGRNLEDLMVGEAIRWMLEQLPSQRVEFEHQTGPRNEPARQWLARWLGRTLTGEQGREASDIETLSLRSKELPVVLTREPHDGA